MHNYYPLLLVGGIIGTISLLLLIAYGLVKDKKEAMGFERNMKDSEIMQRLVKYAAPYKKEFIFVGFLMLFSIAYSIISPLLKPITMTNVVFVALSIWNDYILASTLLSLKEVKTLPLMTYAFLTTKSADYAPMMAGLVLTMLPVMILYLFGQRYIIEGIVAGSVKG